MRYRISILRLLLTSPVTLAVTLGLLVVPVECTVAAGPHSLFISAEGLASLQAGDSAGATHHTHGQSVSHDVASDPHEAPPHQHGPSPAQATASAVHHPEPTGESPARPTGATASPLRTAGFASDSIVALDLPGIDSEPAPLAPLSLSLSGSVIPPDHLPPAPEPPPP